LTDINYNLFLALFLIIIVCVNFRVLYSQISFTGNGNSNILSSAIQKIPSELKIYESFNTNDNLRIIQFDIPSKGTAAINIHDISGNTIRNYVYDMLDSGKYEIKLNKNELPAGHCFATLSCDNKKKTIKLNDIEY
jgi:hypothetical protein